MKNLINYLKALWRRGLGSQRKKIGVTLGEATIEHPFSTHSAPFGTCWQPSGKLHSVVRCAAMLVMLFTIGSGNAWGAYTYSGTGTFNKQSTIDGNGYYVIVLSSSGAMTGSASSNYVGVNTGYNGSASSISNPATSIVLQVTNYDSTNKKYYINNNSGNYLYSSGDKKIAYSATSQYWEIATVSKKERLKTAQATVVYMGYVANSGFRPYTKSTSNVQSVSAIYKLAATTPSVTPDPTSLSWGTVLQGSSQGNKTISITGANLTAGTLTISATGGYSVTPTSKSVSGTLAATTLTVTPPSTSTTGAKNGKVTISGGGLASNVEVNLSMTVNAASTVTWMNNGSEYTTTLVANGSKPEFPDNPTSCDGTSTTFVGWTPTPWSGKLDDISAKTIYTSGAAMPNVGGAVTYHAVFAAQSDFTRVNSTSELATGKLLVIVDAYNSKTLNTDLSASTAPTEKSGKITPSANMIWTLEANSTNWKLKTGSNYLKGDANPTSSSKTKTISLGTSGNLTWVIASNSYTNNGTPVFSIRNSSSVNAGLEYSSGWKLYYTTNLNTSYYTEKLYISSYSKYLTTCCTEPGLNYGTASVTKTFGNGTFKNTLTNSHSVSVTYESSNTDVATVASDGTVTIQGAGNATITARFAGNSTYCADEASYTLTVNKADISPTLTYDPAAVTVGSTLTSFTLSGNSGSGSVSYSSSNDAIATVNSSGEVTGVAPGTVTITATIGATANYNGNTATSNTITINAAACTGAFSLHTGTKNGSDWVYNQCFTAADWGDPTHDLIYTGAFPLTNECYVGYAGGNSDHGAYWAVGGIKTYDIPNGRTLGWNSDNYYESYPGGALGTFHIYSNSGDENYYLRFKPSSYILRTGTDGTSWTSREMTVSATNSHYYETAELDLTSTLISEHAYVDLKTSGGDGHVWCNFSNDRTASGNVKVKSSVGDADGNFRGDNLKASDNGTHGKFRIDITKDVDNWKLAFVPMYRITYAAGTGASGSMAPSSYAEISTNIAAAANDFTAPTGKQFNGWSDGVNTYSAGDNVTMNSNVTLTAQWTDIDYTVTVNQNPNVSAKTTGQTSSAHYNGTINLTTTVPNGYRFVNWTTTDGFSITNPTSATTASFTMPAKNVTVTANFQQTHTVDWYVGGSAPANKIGDDGQTTVVDHGGKIEDFPATTPDGSACDKTFVGWTNTSSYVHGTSPLFNDVAGSPQINADASFYAVFATESGGSSTVFSEDFSTCSGTGGNSGGWSGSIASASVPSGISTSWYLSKANAADECLKLGTGSAGGSAETPDIDCGTATSATLTFRAGAWDGSSEGTTLSLSASNCSIDKSSVTLVKGSFTSYTVAITSITDDIAITFYTSSGNQRFFLDDVVVTASTLTYTDHTITCSDCGTSVTPTFTAAPTGGTVAVTKGGSAVTSGDAVKTCTSQDLSVTITPASHYTLTGFTASGLTTGTATISPAVNTVLPSTSAQTFTVTVSAAATGTLNLTPVLTEDAHKVISWVVHGSSASIADGHGTTWVYSGENLTAIPDAPDAPTGCDDKVFVGWSENDGGATEGDASDYTDLFTTLGGAPTGITTDKTFTAVFATPAAGLGGTVMWDEPWTGESDDATPSSQSASATVYNSTTLTYTYSTSTRVKTDGPYAGGTSPELLVKESGGYFTASNIPTAGQTSLTLTYKSNKTLTVSTNTSGVTIGDPDVDGSTYTQTITIDQSGLGVANFDLVFTKTAKSNARLDDIHLVVPGSSSMSGYVTTCEDTWTVTYYKNTEDAVTNLPSPTGISKSTGSGTLSSKVPVRYGYTFDGWAISAGGSVAYAAGAAVSSVSADMDLYAKWSVTPVTEINLSKTSLDKYVGDPSVILSVLSVLPDGANTSVTWSSSNPSVATVNSTTGEVNFVAVGTANIIATSTITSGTTATCVVTVWAKPSVSFLDNLHSLTEDKDGNALSGYNITDVAGTPVVFPVLANQPAGSGTCEDEFYVFVGWTTSDNNTDPEDHLVTSHNLTNGDNITYYAVWANGVSGTTYTKLTSSKFKTSPTKYVLGAAHADSGTEHYFYSCDKTDKNNSWGYVTADLASNTPIEFTLSGTAAALVATSTEVSARYLKPLATKDFQLSASSQTVELKSDGTIYNNNVDETDWRLLYNMAGGLRWYSSTVSGSASAYFYEVVAGGEVNYRTSCCADKVSAPIVTATKTSTTVTLTWAAVSGATGYELQWNGGAWTAATSGVVKSDLTPNTNYSWRVRATYVPPKCGADIASGSTTTNQVYHVTYAGGSGTGTCNATGSTTDATAYEAGATVTLQSNGFTLVGHTFNEWTEDDEDITISSNQFTMPEHDVVITATWTPKVDKFYDRMHDGTDASHGGIADGDGKYYITREGCSYTVPSLTDNTSGATACHTKHYVLMGWTAESHLNSDGTLKTGHEGYVYTGGGTQTATGATYYAVWAEVEE